MGSNKILIICHTNEIEKNNILNFHQYEMEAVPLKKGDTDLKSEGAAKSTLMSGPTRLLVEIVIISRQHAFWRKELTNQWARQFNEGCFCFNLLKYLPVDGLYTIFRLSITSL